jgi:hypothetical protein
VTKPNQALRGLNPRAFSENPMLGESRWPTGAASGAAKAKEA